MDTLASLGLPVAIWITPGGFKRGKRRDLRIIERRRFFSGSQGISASGAPASVGKGYSDLITLAPALEYSWNPYLGIIAGPWMSRPKYTRILWVGRGCIPVLVV